MPVTSCSKELAKLVYIDDFNSIEKIRISGAQSHITTKKRVIKANAPKSEQLFEKIGVMASEINMRVNQSKTQLLCIHANKNSVVNSYINTDSGVIESGDALKILGFQFNNSPDASYHVGEVILKFYNRLWTLRFLKRSGMDRAGLLLVYKSIIRPFVEYCSTVYHTCLLYTSPSPRDLSTSRMPSSA